MLLLPALLVALSGAAGAAPHATPLRGGTFRVGWDYSFQGDGFDPTGESQTGSFGIYSNLLLRTLVQTDHVAGAAGRRLVPDLAVSVPAPTGGGRSYTFTLKRGIRFGPPVGRPIVAGDIRYAIERLARPRNGASYPFYFDDIRGFEAYRAGRAASVVGIETPNRRTIVFDLVRPDAGFLYRLTLPAAAPIPAEVAGCFEGRPGAYGRDLVASGPYMIEGADAVSATSCASLTPMRGLTATSLTLVRNPDYDPRTDRKAAREANPDQFVFSTQTNGGQTRNEVELAKEVTDGELDATYFYDWPPSIAPYLAAARRSGLIRVDPADWVVYLVMNLTQPPFDDVHVRRALSWLLDRATLEAAVPGAGKVAGHLIPDDLLDGTLERYAPFATPGNHGDLAKAKAEMAKSRYATRNGVCIAKACKHVFFSPLGNTPLYSAGTRMAPIVEAEAAKLGIQLVNHERDSAKIGDPSQPIAVAPNADWAQDYPDPASFVDQVFSGTEIRAAENFNFSLVGLRSRQAARLGVKGDVKNVPTIDTKIQACAALEGAPRIACYASLDRELTARIVPWIPLVERDRITILGPQVAEWNYDAANDETAYAHVSLRQ